MPLSQGQAFDSEAFELAALAKALGHPARVAMVRLLSVRTSCTVGEFVQELPLSQSTVSQHLKELSRAGLVQSEAQGSRIHYNLNPERWARARLLIGTLLAAFP